MGISNMLADMKFLSKTIIFLVILNTLQATILDGTYHVIAGDTEGKTEFTIDVKGIRSAEDAYKIKLALSRLEGVKKVRFIIESGRFRGCCSISEEYNAYLKNLASVPMLVLAKGRSANEILDFLYKRFEGFLFELRK